MDSLNGEMCGAEWDGPKDFSIFFKCLWDDTNIYFFFNVLDDKKVKNFNSIVPWFENDVVELFFSPKRKI
jgi:hypothetical protein